jgi:YHS domain-containing protein
MPLDTYHDMFTDPVCGATVHDATAPTAVHYNTRFHFCSEECQHKFVADPDNFAVEVNTQPWFYTEANKKQRH